MTSEKPSTSWPQRLLNTSLVLLAAVIALSLALDILSRIWPWLLVIGLISLTAAVIWRLLRWRSSRW